MSDSLIRTAKPAIALPALSHTTLAGFEANAGLGWRRALVLTLNLGVWVGLVAWAAHILGAGGGWTALDTVVLLCIAFATPWPVLGFWNAVIGLTVLHGRRRHISARSGLQPEAETPLWAKTAVVMTIRNEDPARALKRLAIVKDSLDRTGAGSLFSYFVLSDTDQENIAEAEKMAVDTWRLSQTTGGAIVYRCRTSNEGFKAGNIRDFCERYGAAFDFMLPLDADSLMTGPAILKVVRIMQAHPRLGILQSLVTGTPARSAFARLFQFGMRLGMRAYTAGQAWWTADCGPYWGHNAIVRIKPFIDYCELPLVPGGPPFGGSVLSHDQIEAVLMRRAGFEVRVVPFEDGSYEDNPPDVLEYIRRDVRWCQGNLQYVKLLKLARLEPVSRYQLVWAILMFLGSPAWTVLIALSPFVAAEAQDTADFRIGQAEALYATVLLMHLAPKIAGFADAWLTSGEVQRFGGKLRFVVSAACEIVFSFLLGAASTLRTTIFMLGLPFGLSIKWEAQDRDLHGLRWVTATCALWPQTAFGLYAVSTLWTLSPEAALWSLPLTAGYLLAIPFAVVTANGKIGCAMQRFGLAAIPEDFDPPAEIVALNAEGAVTL
jgi:membrane glycosyltransferase